MKNVLIKYSIIFISLLLFSSCKKKSDLKSKNNLISTYKVESNFIIKGNDSIFLMRKRSENKNQMDSVFLRINKNVFLIKIPMISYYSLELKKDIPKNKKYDFSNNDFLIIATYNDFMLQYQFDYKLCMLKNIYMITNIDEVYPDFNKKPTDSIAKVEIVNVYKSQNLENYLNRFERLIYNDKVKPNKIYYVLRKDGLKEFID